MRFNPFMACVALLMFSCVVMMIISIAMPDWSSGDFFRAGLWANCAQQPVGNWFCGAVRYPIEGNPMMVTVRVCSIWGLICVFTAMILAYAAFATENKYVAMMLLGMIVCGFVLLCIAWGCWIGVHNEFYGNNKMGLGLTSSFIMCCVSAGFCFLAFYLALIGLAACRRHNRHKRAKEVACCDPGYDNHYAAPAAYAPPMYAAPYAAPAAAPMYPVVDTPYTTPYAADEGAAYFY